MFTNISHMYVGVKLVNYPHLYYFSHFTHFTLYLRMCEKYQILFNFVLISKFPISIMETSTLFPRHLEKHKFLLRSIEGVAFLTRDIGNYPCLTEASTADHYSQQLTCNTVLWKYSRIPTNFLSGDCKFTKFTQHMNSHNCISYMDHWNILNGQLPSKHCATTSLTILNFYLNTFSTQIPMKCGRRNKIGVLNYFLECVKLLKISFHLNIHRLV